MMRTSMCLIGLLCIAPAAQAQNAPARSTPPAPPPSVSLDQATAAPQNDTWRFREFVMASDAYEMAAGHLAMQRSRSGPVRAFANMIATDHGQSQSEISHGMIFSTSLDQMDAGHAAMLAQLSTASGRRFDRLFLAQQIAGHQQALGLYGAYAQNGWEPVLREHAQRTLPMLETHLRDAQALMSTRR